MLKYIALAYIISLSNLFPAINRKFAFHTFLMSQLNFGLVPMRKDLLCCLLKRDWWQLHYNTMANFDKKSSKQD